MLTVAHISADKGEKKKGTLQVTDGQGNSVEIPVVLVNGTKEGPALCVTAGVHGAEYPGIEAALRLSQAIVPDQLKGSLIVLPIVNTAAFFSRSIYVNPHDSKNLNRVFPGKSNGSMSEIIAYTLMDKVAPKVTHFVDLHGGDMIEALHPFILMKRTKKHEINSVTEKLALHFGIETIMEITEESTGWTGQGTFFVCMADREIPSLICEAGGCGQLDEPSTSLLYTGMMNVMRFLGMLAGSFEQSKTSEIFHHFVWINSKHQGIFYAKHRVGECVKPKQFLGEIRDYSGTVLQSVLSPVEGRILFLVTSPAMKEGSVLMGVGTKEV